jgi:coenzyme PQQ precursor peptide PqqA
MPGTEKFDWTCGGQSGIPTTLNTCLSKYETGGNAMKTWTKPAVREQEVGLEVTSYLPAEIDVI